MKLEITQPLSVKIYQETGVFFEPKTYYLNMVYIQSPSTVNGVNLNFPFTLWAFTHINPNGLIQNCTIGRYCSIATGVKIGNGNHPINWLSVNACQYIPNFHGYPELFNNKIKTKSFTPFHHTVIGNDVWIGANVYIKDGVTIGDGAIIGANSVVTHNVEPYAIMAGAPARLLRYRFEPEIIKKLLKLKWWEYSIADFGEIDFDDIEKAIAQLKLKLPTLKKYVPKVVDFAYFSNLKKEKTINIKKKLFGLIKVVKQDGYKTKYFMGIKLYKKKQKEKNK